MKFLGIDWSKTKDIERVDESLPQFKGKGEDISIGKLKHETGEGWEFMGVFPGADKLSLGTFSSFYSNYINKQFENELQKIYNYRDMANYTEIADVIEDATNESTQTDHEDRVINLEIIDPELNKNENIVSNIRREFTNLFYKTIKDFPDILWDMVRTYYIDGRVYYERVINQAHQKRGIVNIKKLPSETMDFIYDPGTGKTILYFQYLLMGNQQKTGSRARPRTIDEAKKRNDIIVFEPAQIGTVNYGVFGKTRQEVFGYLDKVRIPYNQLKLLETSVVIYRLIRSPERLVFRIDTGNMPRDKALKYVEKIKQKLSKKQTYDPSSGQLSMEPEVFSMLENYYLPQSADGRGSQIDTIGGNPAGFAELDDIYYFSRKMYRAMKYPMSRVSAGQEKREADIMFGGSNAGEISRDEIKWAKFLERQQFKFCREFTELFLLHLEFMGLKQQYDLNHHKIKVVMTPPSNYKEQMEQHFWEARYNNYQALADRSEMSKYYLMKKFLKWTDEDIAENVECMKKDKALGLKPEEEMM